MTPFRLRKKPTLYYKAFHDPTPNLSDFGSYSFAPLLLLLSFQPPGLGVVP